MSFRSVQQYVLLQGQSEKICTASWQAASARPRSDLTDSQPTVTFVLGGGRRQNSAGRRWFIHVLTPRCFGLDPSVGGLNNPSTRSRKFIWNWLDLFWKAVWGLGSRPGTRCFRRTLRLGDVCQQALRCLFYLSVRCKARLVSGRRPLVSAHSWTVWTLTACDVSPCVAPTVQAGPLVVSVLYRSQSLFVFAFVWAMKKKYI